MFSILILHSIRGKQFNVMVETLEIWKTSLLSGMGNLQDRLPGDITDLPVLDIFKSSTKKEP